MNTLLEPSRLVIVSLSILLGVSLVAMNADYCGSVFETQVGHALVGHVMETAFVQDDFECQQKCLANNSCKSFNVHFAADNTKLICELNNKTRRMKPGDFKRKKGSNYYGSLKVSCIDVRHEQNGPSDSGHCHPGYKGKQCQTPTRGLHSHLPAQSCNDIRDSGDSKGDGDYWIDPEKSGKPLKVYCDMTTDRGGWLLISKVVMQSSTPPSQLPVKTSYRGISSDQMVLTKTAMKEFRTHLPFTQLRFHCSKHQGRTFHVTTAVNSSGEAVVRYFSGQTDVQPASCGSFVRIHGDNSRLSGSCERWGRENGRYLVGKWGHGEDEDRLYVFAAFTLNDYHWTMSPGLSRWECDDLFTAGVSSSDFWKVFVR